MSETSPAFAWSGRIRFVDTDASGRIHYSSVFRHLEAAEHEFLRSIGHPYAGLEASGLAYPRVRVECDYLAPLRYDDEVAVTVAVARVGRASFTLAFDMTSASRTAARARITVACMHRASQKSYPLPEALAESLRRHMGPAGQSG